MEQFDLQSRENVPENVPIGTTNRINLHSSVQLQCLYFVTNSRYDVPTPRYRPFAINPLSQRTPLGQLSTRNPLGAVVHRRLHIVGNGSCPAGLNANDGYFSGGGGYRISITLTARFISRLIRSNSPIHSVRLIGDYSEPEDRLFVRTLARLVGMRVYASESYVSVESISLSVNQTEPRDYYYLAHEGDLTEGRFFFYDP
ncbi:MAG: hypothetical protein LBI71_02975 [Enterobacteriaceae bacterium]|jgi:hypothetical protein|nr:hypothetical protein [Enterobacteriaceae bacterium]